MSATRVFRHFFFVPGLHVDPSREPAPSVVSGIINVRSVPAEREDRERDKSPLSDSSDGPLVRAADETRLSYEIFYAVQIFFYISYTPAHAHVELAFMTTQTFIT